MKWSQKKLFNFILVIVKIDKIFILLIFLDIHGHSILYNSSSEIMEEIANIVDQEYSVLKSCLNCPISTMRKSRF